MKYTTKCGVSLDFGQFDHNDVTITDPNTEVHFHDFTDESYNNVNNKYNIDQFYHMLIGTVRGLLANDEHVSFLSTTGDKLIFKYIDKDVNMSFSNHRYSTSSYRSSMNSLFTKFISTGRNTLTPRQYNSEIYDGMFRRHKLFDITMGVYKQHSPNYKYLEKTIGGVVNFVPFVPKNNDTNPFTYVELIEQICKSFKNKLKTMYKSYDKRMQAAADKLTKHAEQTKENKLWCNVIRDLKLPIDVSMSKATNHQDRVKDRVTITIPRDMYDKVDDYIAAIIGGVASVSNPDISHADHVKMLKELYKL